MNSGKYLSYTKQKECVAVLIGLYKANGAVSHFRIDFLFIENFHLVLTPSLGRVKCLVREKIRSNT